MAEARRQRKPGLVGAWLKSARQSVTLARRFSQFTGRFTPHVRRQLGRLLPAQVAGIGYLFLGLLEPWPFKMIFDHIFLGNTMPDMLSGLEGLRVDSPLSLLNVFIGAIILIAVLRGVCYYFQSLLTSRAGQQIVANIRLDLYSHLQNLSFSFHDRRRTGDLISRLTTDIRILRDLFVALPVILCNELGLMIGMVVVMALMDLQLTLISLVTIPILAVLVKRYRLPMKQAIRKQREREGHLASLAAETLGAFKVVQGFHRERCEVKKFSAGNKKSLRSGLKAARMEAKLRWASEISVAIVAAIIMAIAARRVLAGVLSPGDLLVFVAYLRAFNRPLRRISKINERLARGTASAERVTDLLEIERDIRDREGAVNARIPRGRIRYENVVFSYAGGEPVLHDVSLELQPGERVAVVGPTGSGKSTLAALLPRFYDVTSGRITIDDMDVRDVTLKSLRQRVAIVFQDPILFATSIAENIAYGKPDATPEDIREAAERAGIAHIIEALPEGYDTILGERGGTLSGGQRQCVAIARAFIKDAPILILDEPTTGLDTVNASLVMDALARLMEGKTVLHISHQLEYIRDIDRVIVMRAGRIVREGQASLLKEGASLYHENTEVGS